VPHDFFTVAVYGTYSSDKSANKRINLVLADCPGPRMFEWNWLNNARSKRMVFDIDGVLCVDPPVIEDKQPEAYREYLLNATPLLIPKVPVLALATSRLERFRPETESWLKEQGIEYGSLLMAPFKTAPERRKHGNWRSKAKHYADMKKAILMVESSDKQALSIHQATRKLVLCVESGKMYGAKTK
jgi:uncharacterized HAD superfamily protein